MTARGSVDMRRIVYLLHGCIWHGHQECDNEKLEHKGVSSLDRNRMTKLQEAAYKKPGFEVVRVWECEQKKMKDQCTVRISHDDPSIEPSEELLKSYVNRIGDDIANKRLIIGDALYGGRTENLAYTFHPLMDQIKSIIQISLLYTHGSKKLKSSPLVSLRNLTGINSPEYLILLKV